MHLLSFGLLQCLLVLHPLPLSHMLCHLCCRPPPTPDAALFLALSLVIFFVFQSK